MLHPYLRFVRLFTLVALGFALATGCAQQGPPLPGEGTPGEVPVQPQAAPAGLAPQGRAPSVGPEIDLSEVMDRAHFAFRTEGDALVGGHDTYEVSIRGGKAEFVAGVHGKSGRLEKGPKLTLETTSIGRAGHVDREAPKVSRRETGEVDMGRGASRETWKNGKDGVEQSWRFEAKPAGTGDLVVEVGVTGLAFVGETKGGLHFSEKKGERSGGVRYGHATFVDAAGVETAVKAKWEGGRVVLRVPAKVVEGAAYPAVLDPVVAPEVAAAASVTPSGNGHHASIACGGAGCLLAVQSERFGRSEVMATRIGTMGEVLDPDGIRLGGQATCQHGTPVVGASNSGFVVGFYRNCSGSGIGGLSYQRLDASGSILDGNAIVVTNVGPAFLSRDLSASCGPTHCALAFVDGTKAALRLVSFSGGPDLSVGISSLPNDDRHPSVAWNGANYLVAWQNEQGFNNSDIRATRVTPAGQILDVAPIIIANQAGNQQSPVVASNGLDYFVAYVAEGIGSSIVGNRVTTAGVNLDPFPIVVDNQGGYTFEYSYTLHAFYNGQSYQVSWRHDPTKRVRTRQVSSAGVVSPSAVPFDGGFEQRRPAGANVGATLVFIWDVGAATGSEAFSPSAPYTLDELAPTLGVRMNVDGTQPDPAPYPLAPGHTEQSLPGIAAGSNQYLSVWRETRLGKAVHVATRLDPTGLPLDPSGIVLDGSAANENPTTTHGYPSDASWNGLNYLTAFTNPSNPLSVLGVRVGADGQLLDPSPIVIQAGQPGKAVRVAWSGVTHVVAVFGGSDVKLTKVSSSGAVGTTGTTTAGFSGGPASQACDLAWNGTFFVLVHKGAGGVVASRLSAAGDLLDQAGVPLPGVSEVPSIVCPSNICRLTWFASGGTIGQATLDGTFLALGPITYVPSPPLVWVPPQGQPSWETIDYPVGWWDGQYLLVASQASAAAYQGIALWREGGTPALLPGTTSADFPALRRKPGCVIRLHERAEEPDPGRGSDGRRRRFGPGSRSRSGASGGGGRDCDSHVLGD